MQAGLLLISLGLLGLFAQSISAKAISKDEDALKLDEAIKKLFAPRPPIIYRPTNVSVNNESDAEKVNSVNDSESDFEEVFKQIFGEAPAKPFPTLEESDNDESEDALSSAEYDEILKKIFGEPPQDE